MTEQIQKNIEAVCDISSVEIRNIDFENLEAIGTWMNELRYLVEKEKMDKFEAYDEYHKMFILSLYTNPLITRESWLALSTKKEELQKIKIATNFLIGLSGTYEYKPPENIWWRFKNYMGTYKLDFKNINFQILPVSLGSNVEIECWSLHKVIPIYKGNKNYELIMKYSQEKIKEKLGN